MFLAQRKVLAPKRAPYSSKIGTVAYWLERLACNVEGSSLVRDSYCVGTLSKFFAHNCSALQLLVCHRDM